jgi:hypothetical protein
MKRREESRKVLDVEVERWSKMSCDQLIDELHEEKNYTVEVGSKEYQVEVQILENTAEYVHVSLGVDDGSLLMSIVPVTQSFIRQKVDSD